MEIEEMYQTFNHSSELSAIESVVEPSGLIEPHHRATVSPETKDLLSVRPLLATVFGEVRVYRDPPARIRPFIGWVFGVPEGYEYNPNCCLYLVRTQIGNVTHYPDSRILTIKMQYLFADCGVGDYFASSRMSDEQIRGIVHDVYQRGKPQLDVGRVTDIRIDRQPKLTKKLSGAIDPYISGFSPRKERLKKRFNPKERLEALIAMRDGEQRMPA